MWSGIAYYFFLMLESAAAVFGIRLSEEAPYSTIGWAGDQIEIRQYAPIMAAEVALPAGDAQTRNQAFRLIFDYISGANRSATGSDKVAMTVPVAVDEPQRIPITVPMQESPGPGTMRFFLPAKYTPASPPPKPIDERVKVASLPERTIAVLRYSGARRDPSAKEQALLDGLEGTPWKAIGQPYTLYYDPPFTIPFLRRNEAAVAVEKAASESPR